MAQPQAHEETAPVFVFFVVAVLLLFDDEGKRVRLIVGEAWGLRSPVKAFSDTIYADVALAQGAALPVEAAHEERAIYTISGEVEIAGDRFAAGQLLVFKPGDAITVRNAGPSESRFVVVGGAGMDGPRYIWWNFVSSRRERIDQAKAEWKSGRFDTVPGDAEEFIPLPEDPPKPVRYP